MQNEHLSAVGIQAGHWMRWETDNPVPVDETRWHLVPISDLAEKWLHEVAEGASRVLLNSGAEFLSILVDENHFASKYAIRLPSSIDEEEISILIKRSADFLVQHHAKLLEFVDKLDWDELLRLDIALSLSHSSDAQRGTS